jgi:hypothetical protein
MSSPFTAEIIQLAAARPQGRDRSSPPDPASFVEPVALARARRDEPTRRAIEARLNGAARHVTVPPIRPTTAERIILQRWIGLACCILSALVVLYFGAELARAVWS